MLQIDAHRVRAGFEADVARIRHCVEGIATAAATFVKKIKVQDEKTRRWLGLPGGGLRDPWSPKD